MMEFQAVGLAGFTIIAVVGWLLIMYWTVRLTQRADALWPGRTKRVVLVTLLGFLVLFMGGWLIATLLCPLVWIGNRRSGARSGST
jgi:hypothetical protein